jgi:hypothetical protein
MRRNEKASDYRKDIQDALQLAWRSKSLHSPVSFSEGDLVK